MIKTIYFMKDIIKFLILAIIVLPYCWSAILWDLINEKFKKEQF